MTEPISSSGSMLNLLRDMIYDENLVVLVELFRTFSCLQSEGVLKLEYEYLKKYFESHNYLSPDMALSIRSKKHVRLWLRHERLSEVILDYARLKGISWSIKCCGGDMEIKFRGYLRIQGHRYESICLSGNYLCLYGLGEPDLDLKIKNGSYRKGNRDFYDLSYRDSKRMLKKICKMTGREGHHKEFLKK